MQSSAAATFFLRIGTRGSPLALAQANSVRALLAAAHGVAEAAIDIVVIRTSGDRIQDRPLAEVGGKGLFTKEIEEALAGGTIDVAVHSAKDMPTVLPDGLGLVACLQREDARDVFISRKAASFGELPPDSVVGTASLRRQALARRLRPDLKIVPFRGNVQTRLSKLGDGAVDATVLALAGLKRLGLTHLATDVMPVEDFLPAVGQGAIALESRLDDSRTRDLLARIDHADTTTALRAEREFLGVLDGSCRTPIAGYATIADGTLRFRGMILRPDGSETHETTRSGPAGEAALIGAAAGQELKDRASADFFTA